MWMCVHACYLTIVLLLRWKRKGFRCFCNILHVYLTLWPTLLLHAHLMKHSHYQQDIAVNLSNLLWHLSVSLSRQCFEAQWVFWSHDEMWITGLFGISLNMLIHAQVNCNWQRHCGLFCSVLSFLPDPGDSLDFNCGCFYFYMERLMFF